MRYLTIVGATDIPEEPFQALRRFAEQAVREFGLQVRSGGADGADTAAELGVLDCVSLRGQRDDSDPAYTLLLRQHLRVYLPYNGFRQHRDHGLSPYVDTKKLPTYEQAKAMALAVHPNPNALLHGRSDFALQAHARNIYQVLGDDLDTPSTMLLCWAPVDKAGDALGGTRTAWMTAKAHDVPVYNLAIHTSAQAFEHLSRLTRPLPVH